MTRLGVIWRIAVGFGLALGAYVIIGITNANWAWLVFMPLAFVGCFIIVRTVFRARAQVDEQRRRARIALSRFEADQREFHAANKKAMLDSPWRQWYLHHEAIGNLSAQGAGTLLDHGGSWVRSYNDPGDLTDTRAMAEYTTQVDQMDARWAEVRRVRAEEAEHERVIQKHQEDLERERQRLRHLGRY